MGARQHRRGFAESCRASGCKRKTSFYRPNREGWLTLFSDICTGYGSPGGNFRVTAKKFYNFFLSSNATNKDAFPDIWMG